VFDETTRSYSQKKLPEIIQSILGGPHHHATPGPGDSDSRMVVVYKDSQCAPRYLITYEKTLIEYDVPEYLG
jgi:hypothetical protein